MIKRIAAAIALLALAGGTAHAQVVLGTNGPNQPYWSLKTTDDGSGNQMPNVVVNGTITTNNGTVAQGSTTSGQTGMLMQGAVTTAMPSYTNGQTSPLSLTTGGLLRTSLFSSGGTAAGFTSGGALTIGGSYSQTPPTVASGSSGGAQIDPRGNLYVNTEVRIPTYSCSASVTLAATPTDVFTIYGSASTSVRIRRVEVSGVATTAGGMQVSLIKRSAVNTGGTSGAVTAVSHDSADSAATGTCLSYTANPAGLGTSVGAVRTFNVAMPLIANAVGPIGQIFGPDRGDKTIVLTGTTQGLAVNLNGGTVPAGGALLVSIEWTEY